MRDIAKIGLGLSTIAALYFGSRAIFRFILSKKFGMAAIMGGRAAYSGVYLCSEIWEHAKDGNWQNLEAVAYTLHFAPI